MNQKTAQTSPDLRVTLAVLSDTIPVKEIARCAGVDESFVRRWLSQEKQVSVKCLRRMYLSGNEQLSSAVANWFLSGGPMVAGYREEQSQGNAMAHAMEAMKKNVDFTAELQTANADGVLEPHEVAALEQKHQQVTTELDRTMRAVRAQANKSNLRLAQ